MAFLSSLDIAGSGLSAQKKRLDVISENVTNRETLRTEDGGPYRRKLVVFREIAGAGNAESFSGRLRTARNTGGITPGDGGTKGGVMVTEVIEDQSDFIPVYDPNHPDADEEGYVWMPNVDTTVEMLDMMAATRSYNSNLAVFEALKNMAKNAMDIGK